MNFKKLEEKLGFHFNNSDLLKQAFTHRSYLNENRDLKIGHNERLEFLGDAVLELITTDYLYNNFPEKNEGELTALRSALVNTITISEISSELGFNDYLLLSKGESKDNGRARQYILANTFESVIGAIYLDQGYEEAKNFVHKFLMPKLDEIIEKGLWIDAKSHLQEVIQEKFGETPKYELVKEEGPDHNKTFTVKVIWKEEDQSMGDGKSKQEAEQEAARKILIEKKWI